MVGCREIVVNSNCRSTLSINYFLNSVPLSDSMYCGHIWTRRYWFMKVDTMVSADLSGIGNASGHPFGWSIMVRMCFCLNLRFHILWPNLWQFCQKDILEFLSSGEGKPEPLLFICSRRHIEWCIFICLCSFLSNSTVFLLGNKSVSPLGVIVYHELPPILCISMLWGLWELRISGASLWYVCKVVLLHEWKDQPCVSVLFHLTITLKYICRKGLSFTFVVVLLIYLLTRISV